MSTALFFITHEGIASNLLAIAEAIIKKTNNNLSYIEVPMDADTELVTKKIDDKLAQLDLSHGILFITDIYGSTPSNIAQAMANRNSANLLCGVNLPMVIRLLNYRDESEQDLIQKALDGAHQGIQHSAQKTNNN